ncbi:hypothetical protein [Lacticaseibacillus hulanensis]|uniref:hypothetical protein n=1 Tax=Lacticaseibacillus hulanensis TaxID=2493111 RepID=UPI000FD9964B|nr:hypothetical protein [Lacticaseibacillus hulanensis]
MRQNNTFTVFIKVLFSVIGIGTALIFLLNGVVSAFGFDAVTSLEFVTGAKGLYIINTLIALLLLVVVGLGIFNCRRLLPITSLLLVVLIVAGYIVARVGLGFSALAVVTVGLVLWTSYSSANLQR